MYVLVSGLPGSGKSTLAAPLATALGWPLLAKDTIKEALWDVVGGGDRQHSARLGAAAQEVLFRLAASAPNAVLDTFLHREWRHQLDTLPGMVVEVHCACPADVARARYVERRRHAAHFDTELLTDTWEQWVRDDAQPHAVGAVLSLDTSTPVDVEAVAAWVRAQ
jgi:predicted kinase